MILSKNNSLLLLHFIIVIWGFTGILGKIIELPSVIIVLHRMIIAGTTLFIINQIIYQKIQTPLKDILKYFGIGLITAIHWVCFFESIKLSNVSLALICLSTISLFTAILDPILQNKPISFHEIVLSLIVTIGIIIIFNFESGYSKAILLSITSAFCGALFTIFNHRLIKKNHKAMIITAWEMLGGVMCILIYLFLQNEINSNIIPNKKDIIYILILGLFCTAFAFSASIEIMKKISPFTVNLTVNLEPIYAIILAIIIFGESELMSREFYIGGFIIISSIFTNTFIKHKSLKIP
ncbi:MAG: EamA family transporter [Flavobacteriales bacterium]|nr:EamA family transporter [Flavobacteriales bacterium]|tara:strand:- start:472 stop:1356 length:885 start_codon:yes stop_codon:yes gene_type:complete